ncbi:hypothetical protein RUM44_002993 [Polyplax serrata]|uniref:Uncharacterized protein n=1 Tax=Polyplax serrata TaxID=468196 RepID=A0ABR1AX84_POLSC
MRINDTLKTTQQRFTKTFGDPQMSERHGPLDETISVGLRHEMVDIMRNACAFREPTGSFRPICLVGGPQHRQLGMQCTTRVAVPLQQGPTDAT